MWLWQKLENEKQLLKGSMTICNTPYTPDRSISSLTTYSVWPKHSNANNFHIKAK